MSESNGKVCCSCEHNIRIHKINGTKCICDIDNHYIGDVECMTGWCKHWKKDRKWEKESNQK